MGQERGCSIQNMIKITKVELAGGGFKVWLSNSDGLEFPVIVLLAKDENEAKNAVQEKINQGGYDNANFKKWT